MTSASLRLSLLLGCAAIALLQTPAHAFAGSSSDAPSIEIHLDVLSNMAAPAATPAPAADAPFVKPAPPAVKASHTPKPKVMAKADSDAAPAKPKHAKKAHPVATAAKTDTTVAQNTAPAPAPAKHTKKAHTAAKPDTAATPAQQALATPTPAAPPAPAVANNDVPKPDLKALPDKTEAALPPAPATPTSAVADVPKLPEKEVAAAAPVKKETPGAKIQSGFSDFLSDDAEKPKADAAPAAMAAAPEQPALAIPPADLTAVAPAGAPSGDKKKADSRPMSQKVTADKDLPSAPPALAALPPSAAKDAPPPLSAADGSSSLPPLMPAIGGDHKDADKMTMASNDATPPLTSAPTPPALPALPDIAAAPDAPKEMAQNTLTPLAVPSSPAAPAPAPVAAMPPAAHAVVAPAPQVPAPALSAPVEHTAAAPAAASAASGAAPDLRLPFNESETDIPLGSTGQLDKLATQLTANPTQRVNIVAFATGPETTGIYPKRVSLARGIAIRNYLTSNKGVDIERVDVKAEGNKNAGTGPGDRVDIFVLK